MKLSEVSEEGIKTSVMQEPGTFRVIDCFNIFK